jgi:hypothetical protein
MRETRSEQASIDRQYVMRSITELGSGCVRAIVGIRNGAIAHLRVEL